MSLSMGPGYPDTDASAMNVACLELWGVAEAELVRKIRTECSAIHAKPGDCSSSCDEPELQRWAAKKSPLLLSTPEKSAPAKTPEGKKH